MPTADPWVDNSFAALRSLGDPGHPFTRPPRKAEGSKRRQHPGWTFASHWNYLPTKTSSAGASLSAPQRGCIPLLSLLLKSSFPSEDGSMFPPLIDQKPNYQERKTSLPWMVPLVLLKPSWGLWSRGWPQQEQGNILHKKKKSATAGHNECSCTAWKSPRATFWWYSDKMPVQQQEVACFLFVFPSALSHLPTHKSKSHSFFLILHPHLHEIMRSFGKPNSSTNPIFSPLSILDTFGYSSTVLPTAYGWSFL